MMPWNVTMPVLKALMTPFVLVAGLGAKGAVTFLPNAAKTIFCSSNSFFTPSADKVCEMPE